MTRFDGLEWIGQEDMPSEQTDVVFFLKSGIVGQNLPWPRATRLIALDPGQYRTSGADPLTSTAFSRYYDSRKDSEGRVLPSLLLHSGIRNPGRVAFVGFSAAHGFLNPLLKNEADRRAIDSVILMDACFGGGKSGYEAALRDAAADRLMLVSVTTDNGPDVLTSGRKCFEPVVERAGVPLREVEVRTPAPAPSGGAVGAGLATWLRYDDVRHSTVGSLTRPILEAYLLPRFRGELAPAAPAKRGGGGGVLATLATAWVVLPVTSVLAYGAYRWLR